MSIASRADGHRGIPDPGALALITQGGATRSSRPILEPAAVAVVTGWINPDRTGAAALAAKCVRVVLDFLESQEGDSWQERWHASGADAAGHAWPALLHAGTAGPRIGNFGAGALITLGAVNPSLDWMMSSRRQRLWDDYAAYHHPEVFARILDCAQSAPQPGTGRHAVALLVGMSIAIGKPVTDLNRDEFLTMRRWMREHYAGWKTLHTPWRYARQAGLMPNEPDELMSLVLQTPKSIPELVDQYPIADPGIRELFIDYLTERSAACDYGTLLNTTINLVRNFWVDIERHNPGQNHLGLTATQTTDWLDRLRLLPDGRPRRHWSTIVQRVRGFYLDIASWAHDDPARWIQWAVPCPIAAQLPAKVGVRERAHQQARMHARTRALAPFLPQLAREASIQLARLQALLAAADVPLGQQFSFDGGIWTRKAFTKSQSVRPLHVAILDPDGSKVDFTRHEDAAFWTWAAVEVLRHSGLRIEEMLELTHLSVRPFRKPSGEIVPLLQVAPSKSDAERILPMSPPLAKTVARIIARHSALNGAGTVPLVARRDEGELVFSAPMPFLFQRRYGNGRQQVIGSVTIRDYLNRLAEHAQLTDNDGSRIRFTPHDFRRIYATDAISNGMPVHILSHLLGHADLTTTSGYNAIYPQDVFAEFDGYLARRRAVRPEFEYRAPNAEELTEFAEHFGRRKVELGDCVRPYASGCVHEHACLRCDFLHVDPHAGYRLDVIETDLLARIGTAVDNEWLGDAEQLRITLDKLHTKRRQLPLVPASQRDQLVGAHPIAAMPTASFGDPDRYSN